MSQPTSLVQGYGRVTAQTLEDRINMYISAVDKATATNNEHQSSQLQQDIQKLVDLMERISAGQIVTEEEVPPPLAITPQTDVLANPLGELSSRLAEYHKALYFAKEELSEDRMNKIQRLQRGLQSQEESRAGKSQGDGTTCIEVLHYEKQLLDKQVAQLKDSLSLSQMQVLKHKSALIEEKMELQQKKLREAGTEERKAYLAAVKTEAIRFEQEAWQYAKLGDAQKFEILMNKKKIADKVIQAIKVKIPDA